MHTDNPEFWEWVKNKIKEREEQQPLQIEIQLPIPAITPPNNNNSYDGIYEDVDHEIKKDIVLLIDWWEHAWALDWQADKKKYLENQWKIINWNHINEQTTI